MQKFLVTITAAIMFASLDMPSAAQTLPDACLALIPDHPLATTTPTGKSDWDYWHSQYDSQLSTLAQKPSRTLFLGDSLTHRWPRSIWEGQFNSLSPVNLGLEQDKTQNLLWRMINGKFLRYSPELVVLLIGTNNNEPPQEVAAGIASIVQYVRNNSPKTHIVLLGLLPRSPWKSFEKSHTQLNTLLKECQYDVFVHFVDYSTLFLDSSGTPSPSFFQQDGLHLNDEGYAVLLKALEQEPFVQQAGRGSANR